MTTPFPEQVAPGGILVYPQIQSPNYVPGVSGWAIFSNGNAEFNSGTFRGTIRITQANGTILVIGNEFIQFFKSDGVTAFGLVGVFDPNNGGLEVIGQNGAAASALYYLADAAGTVVASGPLAANQPGQAAGTAEVWHTLALTTVTASGNGVNGFRYKKLPFNCLLLEWDINTNSVGNAVTIATLPAGWRPATAHNIASGTYGGTVALTSAVNPHFTVNANGTIVTGATGGNAFQMCGTALIGLD